ncbi:hypothetical protein Aperf_G00000009615 [Anoplocephala perfoliata]
MRGSSAIQREALNLDQLSHRNVVQFYGIWETQANLSHLPALVMEFAHGGALHTVVRRRPAVHCATLADWAIQVAEGMRYLHERAGLVHRDLKTANILIREPLVESPGPDDLTGKTLIISDFGMSCHTDAIGSRVSGVGTAAYAAPEVICEEKFSLASDVWSYGVVLWEIFAMLEPFKEFDRAQQLVNIGRYGQKLFIPRPEAGFPEIIGSLLMRCWADEPGERPTFFQIYNYLIDAQNDPFFSISTEEFITRQEAWRREISDDAELSLLSESCSSEASSPLRRQNEFLQQENAKMRDALQALKQNEARYRGTIAELQKDNQILTGLVANTLFKNTAAPAPRKKPFMYNLFRRNESKSSTANSATANAAAISVLSPKKDGESSLMGTIAGDPNVTSINVAAAGAAAAINADRPPQDYSPAVKSTGKRHGKNTRKGSPGISYPSEVRHVVHVPRNLVFESNNELYPPIYRSSNTFVAPPVPSPTSPIAFGGGGGSTSSSSYLRPRTDSQSTDPVLPSSSYIFSPTDDAADNPPQFSFLLTQNKLSGNGGGAATRLSRFPPSNFQHKHHQYMAKSGETGGLTSYKSAPELCEQVSCSKARLNALEGRHTVSRDRALDGGSTSLDQKPTNSSTSAASGGASTAKRHRIGLSSLFHTSRSKLNSSSGKPSSPSVDSITLSSTPLPNPTGTGPDLSPTSTSSALPPPSSSIMISPAPSVVGVLQSNNGRSTSTLSANKRKSLATTPRRLLLHKLFPTDRSRQRRLSGGGSRKPSGKKQQQQQQQLQQQQQSSQRQSQCSASPDSSTILPEDNSPSSLDVESKKLDSESPSSAYIPPSVQIPPLPPYLLRQTSQLTGPRRRLLDIIPPPPAHMPTVTSTAPIPRPCTLTATDVESKGSVGMGPRRRPFVPRLKSQSLDVLYHSNEPPSVLVAAEETEQQRQPPPSSASKETKSADGDEDDEADGGPAPVNPVPQALWSALQVASIAPLLLDCQAIAPTRVYSHTAPQSASFARVTFSPFASNETDQEVEILGKAQSCLGRISSTLALTTAAGGSISLDRSRQPTRQQWNTQRELSAPAPSSSPWQKKLNQLPPVYYSPPLGNGNGVVGNGQETCCKCVCHSAGGGARSRHSSSTTTNSSQSPSPWLPVENPVALSRDAYLKVTQDGYLNCSTVDESLDDDLDNLVDDGSDIASGVHSASSILLGRSLRGFSSSSPLFSPTSFFQQHQQPNQQTSKNSPGGAGGVAVDNDDPVIILPEEEEEDREGELEEAGEPSFGAGEAAEDTATLYEEFESLSAHQGLYKAAFDGKNGEEWGDGCPIPEADALSRMLSLTDRPYPCRRRKAFRLKDKPEGLLSSPEEDSATGASDKSIVH